MAKNASILHTLWDTHSSIFQQNSCWLDIYQIFTAITTATSAHQNMTIDIGWYRAQSASWPWGRHCVCTLTNQRPELCWRWPITSEARVRCEATRFCPRVPGPGGRWPGSRGRYWGRLQQNIALDAIFIFPFFGLQEKDFIICPK